VAWKASDAATGTRTKVWSAPHISSYAGILSAKNSISNRVPLAAITGQIARSCSVEGRGQMSKAGHQSEDADGCVRVQTGGKAKPPPTGQTTERAGFAVFRPLS
jgi:hypothetical protein